MLEYVSWRGGRCSISANIPGPVGLGSEQHNLIEYEDATNSIFLKIM